MTRDLRHLSPHLDPHLVGSFPPLLLSFNHVWGDVHGFYTMLLKKERKYTKRPDLIHISIQIIACDLFRVNKLVPSLVFTIMQWKIDISKRWFLLPAPACVAHCTMGRCVSELPTLNSCSSACGSPFWPPAESICSIPISDRPFLSLSVAYVRNAALKE